MIVHPLMTLYIIMFWREKWKEAEKWGCVLNFQAELV